MLKKCKLQNKGCQFFVVNFHCPEYPHPMLYNRPYGVSYMKKQWAETELSEQWSLNSEEHMATVRSTS
jgi:hypothetical protein